MGNQDSDRLAYKPQDPEALERMMKFMSHAKTEEQLKQVVSLYLFDLSYPRADLLMAEKMTRRAKGW